MLSLAKPEYRCVLQHQIKAISTWICHQALQKANPSHDLAKQGIFTFGATVNTGRRGCFWASVLPAVSTMLIVKVLSPSEQCQCFYYAFKPVFMVKHLSIINGSSVYQILKKQKGENSQIHYFRKCGGKRKIKLASWRDL